MESPYQSPNAHPYGLGRDDAAKPSMLAWWGIIPAVIFVALQVVVGWPAAKARSASTELAFSFLVGQIIGGLIIPFIIAWIAYRVGRRSQLAGTIAFSVVLALGCLGTVGRSLPPRPGEAEAQPVTAPTMTSFADFGFEIPAGWAKAEPDTPHTVAEILHGGAVWHQADGMLKVDFGKPVLPTPRELAQSLAGEDGHVLPNPILLDGIEAFRVETSSKDMSRPCLAVVVIRGGKFYAIMAAATRGADVSAAFDQVLKSWRWSNSH